MERFIVMMVLLLWSSLSFSQEKVEEGALTWYADVSQAYDVSKATSKPIFAFFTGSDWCGWCHKLQREVLTKPAFEKWANDNVVLLELDFPRRKQLPPELQQQNESLQRFFGVTGFPTIWVFFIVKDADNKKFLISPLGTLGYPQGAESGKEEVKFLEDARVVLAKNNTK